MSDLLSTFEQEYFQCCRRVDELLIDPNPEMKEQHLSEAQQQLSEADNYVKQMEVEIEGSDIKYKQEMKQKLRSQKQNLEQLRKKLRIQVDEFQDLRLRENLYGGMNETQKSKLIQQQKNEEKMIQQTMKLQEAKMTGYHVEQQANNIQVELHRQSDIMERNIDRTREANSQLTDSNMLIKRMQDRIRENKMVMYVVMGIVMLAASIVVYTHI